MQDVELSVHTVFAPLNVHRPAIMGLDGQRVAGELLNLCISQAEPVPEVLRDRDEVNCPANLFGFGVDHLDGLVPKATLEHARAPGSRGRLVDIELIRVHGSTTASPRPYEDVMKTASLKPVSVSMVNMTPDAPTSERTIRCTPAESATSECVKP